MGKYCIICHRERPNEAFGGLGHSPGICKKCGRIPKAEQQRIQDEDFLHHALEQRNISPKNVECFNEMHLRYSDELGQKAAAMAELGLVHPRKKKRYGFLYHNKRELFDRMVRLNLIEEWVMEDIETEEDGMIEAVDSLTEEAENDALFYKEYVRDEAIPF